MRILIFGAGVIGSLYAQLFSKAGLSTAVLARGARKQALMEHGLRYQKGDRVQKAEVQVLDQLLPEDRYDFVLVTVKGHQLKEALTELRENASPTLVTMTNTLMPYAEMEALAGKGRILPGFPGAGGGFSGDVLQASLTPKSMQVTTFGEIDGHRSERVRRLQDVLSLSGIPFSVEKDMRAWQLCHLAMVVPIGDAYLQAEDPERAGFDKALMAKTARQIKDNLRALKGLGVALRPFKMQALLYAPGFVARRIFTSMFQGAFGQTFFYPHVKKAPEEMRALHEEFYAFLRSNTGTV